MTYSLDGWPTLRIEIDGAAARTVVGGERRAQSHWLFFVAEPGFADLELSRAEAGTTSEGATLVIERVEVVPL